MKKYVCIVCGFIYDEAQGLPDEGIAPGTRWNDIPEDWCCPDCGVSKSDFEMEEVWLQNIFLPVPGNKIFHEMQGGSTTLQISAPLG